MVVFLPTDGTRQFLVYSKKRQRVSAHLWYTCFIFEKMVVVVDKNKRNTTPRSDHKMDGQSA